MGVNDAAFLFKLINSEVGGGAEEVAFDRGLDVDGIGFFPEFEKGFLNCIAGQFVVVEDIQCDQVHGMGVPVEEPGEQFAVPVADTVDDMGQTIFAHSAVELNQLVKANPVA